MIDNPSDSLAAAGLDFSTEGLIAFPASDPSKSGSLHLAALAPSTPAKLIVSHAPHADKAAFLPPLETPVGELLDRLNHALATGLI